MNRRELLKLFGAGAAAVPLIAGVPRMEAAARLVEPAKVEPVQLPDAVARGGGMVSGGGMFRTGPVRVTTENLLTGQCCQFMADDCVISLRRESRYLWNRYSNYAAEVVMGPSEAAFEFSGHIRENTAGELMQLIGRS